MEKLVERFLKYISFETTSDESSDTCPSNPKEFELARYLEKEMKDLGLKDVYLSENCYLYATLPGTDKNKKTIGFISHMDTSPDMSGKNVNPRIIDNYDGKDIKLNEEFVTSLKDFPFLKDLKGHDIIVTDGTSLLGADDKAGIAIIMTAIENLMKSNEKYGDIKIAFTPDEEIGRGADLFDVERFAADFAYTVDGGAEGEFEYENFNAASAKISIQGKNVHPGSAKNAMVNSILIAMELNSLLPADQRPEHTEGREGFFHLNDFNGNVEYSQMYYIIRDHSFEKFEEKKKFLEEAVKFLNIKYDNRIKLEIKDQYYNMKEKILPHMEIVDLALESMEKAGVKSEIIATRGGTDGSQLSYKGLPCPNLFTGGYNYHGRYELVSITTMKKAVKTVENIGKIGVEK